MYLTKWGQAYGETPHRQGNIFFVAPGDSYTLTGPQGQRSYSASDEHDGLSPERALRSVARAITLSVADSGDVIRCLRGTHTVTATLAPKAGTSIVGERPVFESPMRGMRYPTTLTIRGTNDELLNIAASNVEIGHLNLQGTAGYSVVSFQTTDALAGLYLHDYFLDLDVNAAATRDSRGIDFYNRAGGQGSGRGGSVGANVASAYLVNGYHETNGANGEALLLASVQAECVNLRFHNIAGTWATPVLVATNVDNSTIDACVWTTSGTMTCAMAGPVFGYAAVIADGVHIFNCRTTGNLGTTASPFVGFTAGGVAGADLAENYVMGTPTTSAGGGTLVTTV